MTYYTAFCFKCAELGREQPYPGTFGKDSIRDYWAAYHTKATGHTVVCTKVVK